MLFVDCCLRFVVRCLLSVVCCRWFRFLLVGCCSLGVDSVFVVCCLFCAFLLFIIHVFLPCCFLCLNVMCVVCVLFFVVGYSLFVDCCS